MPNQNQPAPAPGHLLIHSAREAADQGQWDRALMNFNQAIAANSAWNLDPDFKHDRAIALFHTGNQEGALSELNEAVTLQPDYGYRYAARAWMKQALKDIQGAMADYETAIALDPDDAISLNNLGLLEEQQGYRQEAKERFAAADELAGILQKESIAPAAIDQQNESPVPEAPSTKETQGPNLLSEIKRALQQPDGRKEFIAFIRNGFKL
jgi:tetratricopeptide (TPR) repeat protein